MITLTKLLLAQFRGDFLLQPDKWVEAKEEKKLKAYQLYLHALLHGVLIMILVWDWSFWKWALLIAGAHLIIDAHQFLSEFLSQSGRHIQKKKKRIHFKVPDNTSASWKGYLYSYSSS
jgi:hypothetical protein